MRLAFPFLLIRAGNVCVFWLLLLGKIIVTDGIVNNFMSAK
jgi:hypothetical protein